MSIRDLVLAIIGCMSAAPLGAVAQDDTSIFGTHAVVLGISSRGITGRLHAGLSRCSS